MPETKTPDNQLVEVKIFTSLFDYDTIIVRWCYSYWLESSPKRYNTTIQ